MLCLDCYQCICPRCKVTTATAKSQLDDLHTLIDCIQQDMTLEGLEDVNLIDPGTLAETLMAFLRHHQQVVADTSPIKTLAIGSYIDLAIMERSPRDA